MNYLEEKRLKVLEEIKPICDIFGLNDYDYLIDIDKGEETLRINDTYIGCTSDNILAIKNELIGYIFINIYCKSINLGPFEPHIKKQIKRNWIDTTPPLNEDKVKRRVTDLTSEEVEILKLYKERKLKRQEATKRLGCSVNQFKYITRVNGFLSGETIKAKRKYVEMFLPRYLKCEMTAEEVAKLSGVSKKTVYAIVKEKGLKKQRDERPMYEYTITSPYGVEKKVSSVKKVCEELNVTKPTLSAYFDGKETIINELEIKVTKRKLVKNKYK